MCTTRKTILFIMGRRIKGSAYYNHEQIPDQMTNQKDCVCRLTGAQSPRVVANTYLYVWHLRTSTRLPGHAPYEEIKGSLLENQLSGNNLADSYQADDSHARRLDDARIHGSAEASNTPAHRVSCSYWSGRHCKHRWCCLQCHVLVLAYEGSAACMMLSLGLVLDPL